MRSTSGMANQQTISKVTKRWRRRQAKSGDVVTWMKSEARKSDNVNKWLKMEAEMAGDTEDFPIHVDTDIEDDMDIEYLWDPVTSFGFMQTEHQKQRKRDMRMKQQRVKVIREARRKQKEEQEYHLREENLARSV